MEDGKNEIFYDDQTASDTVGASVGGGAWETPKPLLPNTDRELQGISYYCTILHFFIDLGFEHFDLFSCRHGACAVIPSASKSI